MGKAPTTVFFVSSIKKTFFFFFFWTLKICLYFVQVKNYLFLFRLRTFFVYLMFHCFLNKIKNIDHNFKTKQTKINIHFLNILMAFLSWGSLNKFPDFFFVWAHLLIVYIWNSSPLWSNLWLQCTCCIVPRPHGSPLVWACQWPLSQPLSSPQLSHNDSLWA